MVFRLGFADRLRIPQKEASELIKSILNFPKSKNISINFWIRKKLMWKLFWAEDVISKNYCQNHLRKSQKRNAINEPFQGSAADLIKIAMISISKNQNQRLKTKMLLQVRWTCIWSSEENWKLQPALIRKLCEALTSHPLAVDIKYGKAGMSTFKAKTATLPHCYISFFLIYYFEKKLVWIA